jgi:hypothetical protein
MANTIKFKRGTNLSNAGTPSAGEPVYTTNTKKLYIGDGSTAAASIIAISDDKIPLTGTTALAGHIIPATDDTYDLGSSSKRFRNIYVGADSLYVGSTAVGESDLNISNWDTAYSDRLKWDGGSTGLTASTARSSLGLGALATLGSVAAAQIDEDAVGTSELASGVALSNLGGGSGGTFLKKDGTWAAPSTSSDWSRDTSGSFPFVTQGNTNDIVKLTTADGANINTYIFEVVNLDQTADQGYGVKIQSGNNATDSTLVIRDRAGNDTAKFKGDRTSHFYGAATFSSTLTWSGGGSANANTAYGWGNHASAGYLESADVSGKANLSGAAFTGDVSITRAADTTFTVSRSDQTNIKLISAGSSYIQASADLILRSNGANNRLTIDTSGTATFSGDLVIPQDIFHAGDNDTALRFTDNQIALITGNVVRLTANNSGVQIPDDVVLDGDIYIDQARSNWRTIQYRDTDNSNAIQAYVSSYNTGTHDGFLRLNAIESLQFRTGDVERLKLTNNSATFAGTITQSGNYFTIDNTAQNGIKIYGNDTACHYIYDKADGSLSGGLTWGHADAEFHVYTNGVSTNSQALKITADNTATFAGTINANGGFERRLDHNSGTFMTLNNQNDGTSAYAEMYIKNSDGQLVLGYSDNYSNGEWDGGWVYTNVGNLMLKAAGDVEITAGGMGDEKRAIIVGTDGTTNFYGTGYVNASRFRSSANTNYYTDPDGTSALYALEIYQALGMNNKDITAVKNIVPNGDNAGLVGTQAAMFDGVWTNELNSNDGTVHIQNSAVGTGYTRIYGNTGIGQAASSSYRLAVTGNTYISGALYVGDIYATQWFRNQSSGVGLYNTATTQHFYSDDDNYWNIAGGTEANALRFRDDHDGTVRGGVYSTSSNEIGFIDKDHEWCYRHTESGSHEWWSNAGSAKMTLNSSGQLTVTGGLTSSATINGRALSRVAAVTSLSYQGAIAFPQYNHGTQGSGFTPWLQGTSIHSNGYRRHNYIGEWRNANHTGWDGGIFFAQGGNDGNATVYHQMNIDGSFKWNNGSSWYEFMRNDHLFESGNMSRRLALTGSGDNSIYIGPYDDNGWGYIECLNNASGLYLNTNQGDFAFDNGNIRPYTSGEIALGTTSYYFNNMVSSKATIVGTHTMEITSGDNSLVIKNTQTAGSGGLVLQGSGGAHLLQLYGESDYDYGFLDGAWGHWDMRKVINGRLYMNDNGTYYIQTDGASYFGSTITVNSQGNSHNWYEGYQLRQQWNGGSTNLNADTAKNSLALNTGNGVQFARVACNTGDDANYNLKVNGSMYASGSNAFFQYTNFYGAYLGSNWRKTVVGGEHADIATNNGEICTDGWFRSYGNGGWYSQSHGGGWHMTDSTWIRAYNSKSVYIAANLEVGGTARFDGTTYFKGTNSGYINGYGSQSIHIHKVYSISFAADNTWDAYNNHGIVSTNHNGEAADCVSINSWNDITLRIDTNSNDSASYVRVKNHTTGGGSSLFYVGYNGSANVGYLNGVFTCSSVTESSSLDFKKNISEIENPLDKITKLRGIEFDYKETDEHSIGMIAEEVNEIFPELVSKDSDGKVSSLSYTRMTAVLLEAVKELSREVDDLRASNNKQ